MSIVDQLLESVVGLGANDPQLSPVRFSATPADAYINASTALSIHQAMEDGFNAGQGTRTDASGNFIGAPGTVDLSVTLNMAQDYRRLLVEGQARAINLRETADDFLDGAIKVGSKVIIKIAPSSKSRASWKDLARDRIVNDPVGNVFFDKFSVQSIMIPDEERYQLRETIAANYIYGFGRRPQIIRLSGIVVNGRMDVMIGGELRSMDWTNALLRGYAEHFRLTPTIQRGHKVVIYCQDTIYTGYMLNLISTVVAETQNTASVSLSLVLSDRQWTQEQDANIPGAVTRGGFFLPGKETPSDYFPLARIESYFRRDSKNVLIQARRIAEEDCLKRAGELSWLEPDSEMDAPELIELARDKTIPTRLYLSQGIGVHGFFERGFFELPGDIERVASAPPQEGGQGELAINSLRARAIAANRAADRLVTAASKLDFFDERSIASQLGI